ncbi:MAG TPA: Clp protease N-terminal domain-containing protein [Gaiellaceae bacterium]|nr:Clp protease N-terminal domain-containing protein [Gaiellaceae bacterium]
MFERFTPSARSVLRLAEEEARALDHDYIGTEHLLLGLLREGEGIAARVLAANGVTLEPVRERTISVAGPGRHSPEGMIPLTPRSQGVLERAATEADELGHSLVGTEHVFLSMLRETEAFSTLIVRDLGTTEDELRAATLRAFVTTL